jgi:hypothetical protein
VGLTWKPRGGGRSIFDGRDSTGRFYAHATNISGDWRIYIAPWGCGRPGGLALGPFVDAQAAMAAADEYLAGSSLTSAPMIRDSSLLASKLSEDVLSSPREMRAFPSFLF